MFLSQQNFVSIIFIVFSPFLKRSAAPTLCQNIMMNGPIELFPVYLESETSAGPFRIIINEKQTMTEKTK